LRVIPWLRLQHSIRIEDRHYDNGVEDRKTRVRMREDVSGNVNWRASRVFLTPHFFNPFNHSREPVDHPINGHLLKHRAVVAVVH
jgi:hypothetical protein